jgi:membrane peptidoglycan carboxypeptidase
MSERARTASLVAGAAAVLVVAALVAAYLLAGPMLRLAAATVEVEVLPENRELPGLAERSVVLAADGSQLAVLHDEVDRRVVDLDDIPDHVRHAVLAAEDRRFYEHDGYDVMAIARAALANFRAGGVEQGASTITQQLARANFLDREQTMRRKLAELRVAAALEAQHSKDELLERYLNEVYFGAGAYGIAAAAERYFAVGPEDLTVDQAALLTGLIRSPSALAADPERANARRDQVLAAMADEGFIEPADADALRREPTPVDPVAPEETSATPQPYVVEAVKREFARLPAFGGDRDERFRSLFAGGLQITTTLDPRLQEVAAATATGAFPDTAGPAAAIVSVEPGNGAIRALHGGVDFAHEQFDLATQGRRQAGSALKPLIVTEALSQGFPVGAVLDGHGRRVLPVAGEDEPWEVANFGGSDHGAVDLREAVVRSVNTAFAQLVMATGEREVIERAELLGVNRAAAFGDESTWGPSIVLGGLTYGVTPLEMAGAYAALAADGVYAEPFLIAEVTDRAGNVVYTREPRTRQALDPAVAGTVTDMLRDVVARGTGTAAAVPGWDVAGKTGTNRDYVDAWFAGVTRPLATAVWVGHPEGQVPMPGMTGGSLPAQLWQQFMAAALDGREPEPLPAAADLAGIARQPTEVPDVSGMSVEEAIVTLARAGLLAQVSGEGTVGSQQPAAGTTAQRGDAVHLSGAAPPSGPDEGSRAEPPGREEHPHGGPPGQRRGRG